MWINRGNVWCKVVQASADEDDWLRAFLTFDDEKTYITKRQVTLYSGGAFPAGVLARVVKRAREAGFTVDVFDKRGPPPPVDPAADLAWLRDYQLDAVRAALAAENGLVKAPTGSGKTEIMAGLTASVPSVRWLVAAPKMQLVVQAAERIALRRPGLVLGRIGEGAWDVPADAQVVCATFQSLYTGLCGGASRVSDLLQSAGGLIVDEAHTVAAQSFWRVSTACRARYRVGLSGTPLARGDRRNVLVIAALGPVAYDIDFGTLADRGLLVRPDITMVDCFQQPSEAPTWQGVYGENVVRSAARNALIVDAAARATKPGLVFVREVGHGRQIAKRLEAAGLRVAFAWGNVSVDKRVSLVRDLTAGRLDLVVCSVVFQEGIDIPALRSLVVAAGGKSVIAAIQRVGRGTRASAGKDSFEVFDIQDQGCGCRGADHKACGWLARHSRDRRAAYMREGFSVTEAQWAGSNVGMAPRSKKKKLPLPPDFALGVSPRHETSLRPSQWSPDGSHARA